MAARKTKQITFNQGKECRNEVIAIINEAFRNARVTRPPQPATPLTRPIECRPVGGRSSGVPLYIYIYPNDIFEIDKIFFKNYFQKNRLFMPDSRPK